MKISTDINNNIINISVKFTDSDEDLDLYNYFDSGCFFDSLEIEDIPKLEYFNGILKIKTNKINKIIIQKNKKRFKNFNIEKIIIQHLDF